MRYMDMTPEQLRAEYRAERSGLYNTGELARSVRSPRARRMLAGQTGDKLDRFDLICNVARKRGIDLLADGEPEAATAGDGWPPPGTVPSNENGNRGTTGDGRRYRYSSGHNGYVFLDEPARPMTYDEQLIAAGKCPELVPVQTEDGPSDGRCLAPVGPGGYACPRHTAAIESWRAMSEPERAAAERAADME